LRPERELLLEWLERANDDVRMAELALGDTPPVCWGAAFHARRAAEKPLKALLTFHQIEFGKVHSIDCLVDLCTHVEPRYPFPRHEPTLAEAQEALAIARAVREFVLSKLPDAL